METAMTFPKARLVVSAILFLSWLGFLFFLVLETKSVFISKPQFQIAQTVLVVEVRDDAGTPDPRVTVKEVLWGDGAHEGEKLRLIDLLACKTEHGYSGAGDYVIPLMRRGGVWQIAQIPIPDYYKRPWSHGTLELRDPGPDPNCVLDCFLEFAREKPREAENLLKQMTPTIAIRHLGRAFFGVDFEWQDVIDPPRGPLPRLPIQDAEELQTRLKKCGAEVRVNVEEVRIYRWTPEVRGQVLKCKP
jgi:hypothetical protein